MRNRHGIHFGVQLGPIMRPGVDEKRIYDEVLVDCEVAASLGYESIWLVEAALLCRAGDAYEQATEWHLRHPAISR